MKSEETYNIGFYDMVPYIILAAVFALVTIATTFSISMNNSKKSANIPQKNYVQEKNSTSNFLSRDNTVEGTFKNFNKILKNANTNTGTSLKAEKTANASAKQKSAKKVVSKRHASYSKGEVTLMANAIYRECGGYYLNAKSYGLTKAQGLRAAIITGVVMRNRRDTVKDYKSITDVLIAPHQYGKGGQDSLNRINRYHAPQVFKTIAKSILDYKEVKIAKKLVGDEKDFNVKDFQVPKSVYYQSQYSTLGSGKYAQIGNQVYNFK